MFGQFDLLSAVGETFTLGFGVNFLAAAGVGAGSGIPNGAVDCCQQTVSALNTGLGALAILTPGASYTSESGTQYLSTLAPISQVPEPGILLLMVGGFAALVSTRRAMARRDRA